MLPPTVYKGSLSSTFWPRCVISCLTDNCHPNSCELLLTSCVVFAIESYEFRICFEYLPLSCSWFATICPHLMGRLCILLMVCRDLMQSQWFISGFVARASDIISKNSLPRPISRSLFLCFLTEVYSFRSYV